MPKTPRRRARRRRYVQKACEEITDCRECGRVGPVAHFEGGQFRDAFNPNTQQWYRRCKFEDNRCTGVNSNDSKERKEWQVKYSEIPLAARRLMTGFRQKQGNKDKNRLDVCAAIEREMKELAKNDAHLQQAVDAAPPESISPQLTQAVVDSIAHSDAVQEKIAEELDYGEDIDDEILAKQTKRLGLTPAQKVIVKEVDDVTSRSSSTPTSSSSTVVQLYAVETPDSERRRRNFGVGGVLKRIRNNKFQSRQAENAIKKARINALKRRRDTLNVKQKLTKLANDAEWKKMTTAMIQKKRELLRKAKAVALKAEEDKGFSFASEKLAEPWWMKRKHPWTMETPESPASSPLTDSSETLALIQEEINRQDAIQKMKDSLKDEPIEPIVPAKQKKGKGSKGGPATPGRAKKKARRSGSTPWWRTRPPWWRTRPPPLPDKNSIFPFPFQPDAPRPTRDDNFGDIQWWESERIMKRFMGRSRAVKSRKDRRDFDRERRVLELEKWDKWDDQSPTTTTDAYTLKDLMAEYVDLIVNDPVFLQRKKKKNEILRTHIDGVDPIVNDPVFLQRKKIKNEILRTHFDGDKTRFNKAVANAIGYKSPMGYNKVLELTQDYGGAFYNKVNTVPKFLSAIASNMTKTNLQKIDKNLKENEKLLRQKAAQEKRKRAKKQVQEERERKREKDMMERERKMQAEEEAKKAREAEQRARREKFLLDAERHGRKEAVRRYAARGSSSGSSSGSSDEFTNM